MKTPIYNLAAASMLTLGVFSAHAFADDGFGFRVNFFQRQ